MSLLEERQKRIDDAISLKEPDRVPITAPGQLYPIFNAGFSAADAVYDFDSYSQSMIKYVTQYEPDAAKGCITIPGQGPVMELFKPKNIVWPGAPDGRIDINSIQQFIEYAVLLEDDMDYFMQDHTGWLLKKGYPAVSELLEPLAQWDFTRFNLDYNFVPLIRMLSAPASREMMRALWEASDLIDEIGRKSVELNNKLNELGFPVPIGGRALTPFDTYSDFYRGTLDTMMDLYEHPEVIIRFLDENIEKVLQNITDQALLAPGKWVFIPLHKGMDSFLTDEQYRDYYWKYLQRMINHIIGAGMVPYVYTEGPYNSRLKYLSDVPKGKVIYSFEEIDPAAAKKQLGDTACILGVFPVYLLHYGSKLEVVDEAKRLIDILAPGGGYILSTGAGHDHANPENVEALFDTVKTYGRK